jgi:hypothetical protein
MYACIYMRGLAPVLHLIETEQMITDLKDKQIEIIALMNSWVFSRLISENERAGESLAREMDAVAEAEREQGMSRLPLTSSSYAFCLPGTRALRSESHALYFSPSLALTYPWFSALALGVRTDNLFSLTGMVERMRIQLENCVSNIRAALAALSRAVM